MVVKEIEVKLKAGLQADAAALFVQQSSRFSANIFIEKNDRKVNAKSIMGLMSLAIGPNESITLYADGDDEAEAIQVLSDFIVSDR